MVILGRHGQFELVADTVWHGSAKFNFIQLQLGLKQTHENTQQTHTILKNRSKQESQDQQDTPK